MMMRVAEDDDRIALLADMFRMMGDASRLKIILVCMDEPQSVGDIAGRVGLSQSLVSHHLRLLRAARVLRADRRGRHVFYSAVDDHIKRVVTDMVDHAGEADMVTE